MSRCLCSSRALEIFIKDLAGLNVYRSAPRLPITHRRRNFGTRHPLRQLETVSSGAATGGEDGFIPFEFEKSSGSVRNGEKLAKGEEGEEGDEEWHAEVEIAKTWPLRTIEENAEQNAGHEDHGFEEVVSQAGEKLQLEDGIQGTAGTGEERNTQPSTTLHEVSAASAEAEVAAPGHVRSRAENRLLRKQRRVLAGTWAPKSTERERLALGEKQQEDDTNSVLQRIEAMYGPAVEKRKSREAMAKVKQKSTERKKTEVGADGAKGQERTKQAAKTTEDAKIENRKRPKTKRHASETTSAFTKARTNPKEQEPWQVRKAALAAKFGPGGWAPSKKLSPDTMNGIRALHASDPAAYTTGTLAKHFQISSEAIRRILKSKWRPSEGEIEDRRVRWEKRGVKKWEDMAKKGMRPPKKWREMGVEWGMKSRSRTPRSKGLGGYRAREGEEEGVGMLHGIEDGGLEERIT